MKYEISDTLLQNILNYMGTKPYVEVVNLINALSVEIQRNNETQQNTDFIAKSES